jgi:hypothetical protein
LLDDLRSVDPGDVQVRRLGRLRRDGSLLHPTGASLGAATRSGREFCGADGDCGPGQYCAPGTGAYASVFICTNAPASNTVCGGVPPRGAATLPCYKTTHVRRAPRRAARIDPFRVRSATTIVRRIGLLRKPHGAGCDRHSAWRAAVPMGRAPSSGGGDTA